MTTFIMPYQRFEENADSIANNAANIDPVVLYLTDGGIKLTTKKNELSIKGKNPSEVVVVQTDNPKEFKSSVPFIKDFKINYLEVSDKQFEALGEKAVQKIEKDLENVGLA